MSNEISAVLAERGTRYGRFDAHALLTQQIKLAFSFGRNWDNLPVDSKEALEMIAHKIGRVLNGDPEYADSWVDIAGYAKLVADRILKEGEYAEPVAPTVGGGGSFDPLHNVTYTDVIWPTEGIGYTEAKLSR